MVSLIDASLIGSRWNPSPQPCAIIGVTGFQHDLSDVCRTEKSCSEARCEGCHRRHLKGSRSRSCQDFITTRGLLIHHFMQAIREQTGLLFKLSTKKVTPAVITGNFQNSCPLGSTSSSLISTTKHTTPFRDAFEERATAPSPLSPAILCTEIVRLLKSGSLFHTATTTLS